MMKHGTKTFVGSVVHQRAPPVHYLHLYARADGCFQKKSHVFILYTDIAKILCILILTMTKEEKKYTNSS